MRNLGIGNVLLLLFFIVLPLINFLLQRVRKRRDHRIPQEKPVKQMLRQAQTTPTPRQHLVPPATECMDRRRAPLPRLLTIVLPEDRF